MNEIILVQPSQIKPVTDAEAALINLWLHGRSANTDRSYRFALGLLRLALKDKPLPAITLSDLVSFAECLEDHYSLESQRQILYSIKSLFSFAHKTGYLPLNVAAVLRTPRPKNTLAERILTEAEVIQMITLTSQERDKVLLAFLYYSGGRVSEVCALTWRDLRPDEGGEGGFVTFYGKGDKTRAVRLGRSAWDLLLSLKKTDDLDQPIFLSYRGKPLDPSWVRRIMIDAAKRAGIGGNVSPHWLRHSHATHAMNRGAKIPLITATLGHSSVAVTSKYIHVNPDESSSMHLIEI